MNTRLTSIVPILALALLGFSGSALAGHHHKDGLGACLSAVGNIKPGDFVKVEYLSATDEGVPAYEVEVRDSDGNEWEFECSAKDASIIELEREAESADGAMFSKSMNVSEADAKSTATNLYPGTIEEVEYEIEANGEPVYEFDIVDNAGTEWKVEVSAASGEIIEVQVETWEIGEEDQVSGE